MRLKKDCKAQADDFSPVPQVSIQKASATGRDPGELASPTSEVVSYTDAGMKVTPTRQTPISDATPRLLSSRAPPADSELEIAERESDVLFSNAGSF